MKQNLSMAALGLAAALTLSACVTTGTDAGTGAGSTTSPASAGTVSEEHNQADVMFSRMMIPHHEQAVEMSELMLAKDGTSPEISDLATQIRDAQAPEIATMKGWLETWDDAMGPDSMESHDMGDMEGMGDGDGMGSGSGPMEGMEGMLNEDEMAELERAEGTEASRLFLESMTVHHEGAIDMAQDEIENGENPDAIELAETIVTTQQAEIDEMKDLLASP
ncbi:DUF305 domain-containing protein [Arthrobacter sp. SX1312]|uniref:DUF305 domain-containing protein n=1 Tax=Arthrobacter sp. SX1312 TaxID=2058896 RepID=UPI000CE2CF7E|nr:DUF305 domain-containing protein [Arthrobacter sp. SX1312]